MYLRSTYKTLLVIFFLTLFATPGYSQLHQWTWMNGENTTNHVAVYGNPGVAAPGNTPGARLGTSSWQDRSGNFWLYGGLVATATPGLFFAEPDLWKYDPSSGLWTWVTPQGSDPGLRSGAASWTDTSGNFWIFGSWGTYDLHKYTVNTNTWTLHNGGSGYVNGIYGIGDVPSHTNMPGTRSGSCTWTDKNNNLWLFGGYGLAASTSTQGFLNDLWKYNVDAGMWTWVSGDSVIDSRAIYGTQNVSTALNKPGARHNSRGWIDDSGNFWMFGGQGFTTLLGPGTNWLNDIWKYNIESNEWVWIHGANSFYSTSVYGLAGIFDPVNQPGGTSNMVTWVDKNNKFWLFGGWGYDATLTSGDQNGLWQYDPVINQWAFMNGDQVGWPAGVYGTMGVADADNRPGGREWSATWTDSLGNLWLYGGGGIPQNAQSTTQQYHFSDMWKYTLSIVVPVKLNSFTGKLQDEHVLLDWTVDNELNVSRYEIERSTHAVQYEKVGTLEAKNVRQYNFNDDVSGLTNQILYYRLKMIDNDGKFSYSRIISFRLKNIKFSLYPNPANAYTQLKFSSGLYGNVYVEITEASGKKIIKNNYELTGTAITIPTGKLSAGTYQVTSIYQGERTVQGLVIIR